ncbi:branched-chain amino acid ABC transporter permease [Achromobacter denitrificans]|jgi:branched-chain amino acid transport system permease protein|uniref:Branched-chain amino acid ABC transporter permease n=1 Tax=Achromobacter denitrificans TaxID=32002 RepID=A0A427WMA7_ACHDE|nr:MULTISPECIES: branched-chain amino acid ABC transporter permease [Achromobacter]ASC64288.1 branched-chain amino acid ABC transporter permease [Achromobacter denitrificans]MDF3850502.1 branched-chain amino acid ABC transporter permease [Achromobacter denitrificans]MDF3939776.1 branched-chain amino acid ABC transporter permease [Achromobacter denitrificans]MDX3879738.1 branched-chain amino acid ABC transporter permease [Achromobacter sp.]OLU06891.1 branched-chain amino acid ABC transporter pe
MEQLLFSLMNGIVYGLVLFMVSAGLTLIFGMMGVLNFAHASFYMLGAYFAYTLQGTLGFWPAVVVSPLLVGLIGVVVERYFLRRVHRHGHAHELLLTFGLSFIIAESIKLFYGNYPVDYRIPSSLDFSAFSLGAMQYPFYRLLMGGIAIAMFIAIYLVLTRSRVGIVVRSAIYKPHMTEALGHNVPLVFMGVFGAGAALAGLAGAVAGAFYTTNPNMALELGVMVFVVVVVGGLGSLAGAMLASLLIGIITSLAVTVDGSLADALALIGAGDWARGVGGLMTLKLSSLAATLPFALMLLILLLRPGGLMGEKG